MTTGGDCPDMDNPKAELRPHERFGKGVFAREPIAAGETIASFDGETYTAQNGVELPPRVFDHGMQISPDQFRDSSGFARFINHSCQPNCGVKNLVDIVAMRPIAAGEECSWDYDMSDNSDWVLHCLCEANRCRHVLLGYRHLPISFRDEYRGFISEYLLGEPNPLPIPEIELRKHPGFQEDWL